MGEFFQSLVAHSFLRNALFAGLLASVACGVVGTWVVTRRITVIAGSIAHAVLGGMGAAYYLRDGEALGVAEPRSTAPWRPPSWPPSPSAG